jgi:ABC-type Fe3+ transport system permease subunit
MSAEAPPWTALPPFQLVLGIITFGLVALVTTAPVLIVLFGAVDGNVWRETFVESSTNRNAIGYSFLLALRAPIAALIGFLIAWLLIRIRLPFGQPASPLPWSNWESASKP